MPERKGNKLLDKLQDPENPRTPLFFKHLTFFGPEEGGTLLRHARSRFYRADGYLAGIAARPGKPVSKLFKRYDE